jgi:heptosyltransferase-2
LSSATLVVQTAFLGDVVLTTPLFSALAADHGPVDVVTTPIAAPLIETHPAVRKVIPYDKRGSDRGWAGLRNLARRLRTERYARAYLPHRSLRTATLGVLAGIPTRIGFSGAWSFLYTEARPKPALGHESDRLLALANKPPGVYPPHLRPTAEDESVVAQVLEEVGLEGDVPFVALAPGSIWGSKRWPYYPELARQLADHTPLVVVGGQDDVGLGEEIRRAAEGGGGRRRAVNACGQLTLRQSAALIGKALLLVTNDSAPLHLATAMGTPIVALFGPTVAEFGFGPLRPGDVALGIDGLSCRPCSSHGPPQCPLGHHRCMRELTVEAVIAAIEELGALRRRG